MDDKQPAETLELESIYEAVLNGDRTGAAAATEVALDSGIAAEEILNNACIEAMREIGHLYEIGERFVPELLIAARAMHGVLEILEPLLADDGIGVAGKVAIGTVAGDMHDIGKNLVATMLRGAGLEVIDLGTDVSPGMFVAAVREHEPDLVALSALLTSTMGSIDRTLEALSVAGLREKAKVIIGGAPVTQPYAERVGADGYAPDAASAARVANGMSAGHRLD